MNDLKRFTLLCILFLSVVAQSESQEQIAQSHVDPGHTQWIADSLKTIQTIKVGMTRADLTKVFTVEGGLSTTSQRTYVYQQCPYIKVDVTFEASSHEEERPSDKIIKISNPYLAWSISD
jgi:hypothetical protein